MLAFNLFSFKCWISWLPYSHCFENKIINELKLLNEHIETEWRTYASMNYASTVSSQAII